ncbi:helix-turn-helix domain-containing protein [Ornithinimicrobium sp. W1679]|uniref:helix-turn-helix domain-containing protein n=1 Tax=Ornithinimicrobium sp. W1679 TaxID=3418770 RepID=UPI003CE68CD1
MASSEGHRIICRLDELLKSRPMTMTQLSRTTGITMANLSILKTGKAKAVRFSTLTLICEALDCEPGQLLQLDRATH